MILANDIYQISIMKHPKDVLLQSIDARIYDHIFDPCGYMKREYRTTLIITIQTRQDNIHLALIGSFYTNPDHCAVLEGDILTILMAEVIVQINLQDMEIITHKEIGDTPFFSIYHFIGGYIIHGELEILRLNKNFERMWTFSGSDIFVTQNGEHQAVRFTDDQILLQDWNGVRYALDINGKLVWDTYK